MRRLFRPCAAACLFALGFAAVTAADDAKSPADTGKEKMITDAEFVKMAASGGMFEVKSSELAKERAGSAEVKKFADEMIADHGKANKELEAAAKKAGIPVPKELTPDDQKLMDMVKQAKGGEFDMAYMKAQVKGHVNTVKLLENGSKNLKDAGLKAFAEKTLPVVKGHLEHAKKHSGGADETKKRGDR